MIVVARLAVSVSLDTLGVSMAYSAAGITIPMGTRILISMVNGILTAIAIGIGKVFLVEIPSLIFQIFGAAILVILGIRILWNALGENRTADYDRNASRRIELREGCVVGVAFALDSVSAALGILNIGSIVYCFPFCSALLCYVFLMIGTKKVYNLRRLNGISGVILILLGVSRLFFDPF